MAEVVELEISGRSGKFVYDRDGVRAEAYVEMSGVNQFDLLVEIEQMGRWSNGAEITDSDRDQIKRAFEKYAEQKRLKCQW